MGRVLCSSFEDAAELMKRPPSQETVIKMFSVKKVFLKISQDSQKNTCARVSFLIKLKAPLTLLKKRLWHRCFLVNFVKFLRTPFYKDHFWWLLLHLDSEKSIEGAITTATTRLQEHLIFVNKHGIL